MKAGMRKLKQKKKNEQAMMMNGNIVKVSNIQSTFVDRNIGDKKT